MPTLYLIRHGQASFGADDYDRLSPMGEQQAAKLGAHLRETEIKFDQVIRGDMLRHKQTAELALPDQTFEINQNWNEYDHQDILAKQNNECVTAKSMKAYLDGFSQPDEAFSQLVTQAFTRWVGGEHDAQYLESWPAFTIRIEQALQKLLELHSDAKNVAVFTSGGPIAFLCHKIMGAPLQNLFRLNWSLVNCGVTKLKTTRNGLMISSLNEHSIFDGKNKHFLSYK
ncbi:histidine phosphatase family protein [Paraglaciecola sp.]|uniref:histidine phosphatase family protein n=1 Tax=Paraglaciecola sp. TaxID=1920173 RepID=UPI003EF93236